MTSSPSPARALPIERSLPEAMGLALREAMAADPSVMVLGEAVGRLGGVSGVSRGLREDFGAGRVVDLPISQVGAIGLATGLAMGGRRPVVELTGPLAAGLGPLVQELSTLAARTGDEFSAPVVLRAPYGADPGVDGLLAGLAASVPGLVVLCPSTPADAHALLGEALRARGPVLLLESRATWTARGLLSDTPARIGRAHTLREGRHATLLAFGGGVAKAVEAAGLAASSGLEVEVIDLPSLAPLDLDAVAASVRRTGRALVVDELGAPSAPSALASRLLVQITEAAFLYLEAPPRAVAGDARQLAAAVQASVNF